MLVGVRASAIELLEALASVIVLAVAERIASEAGMSRVAAEVADVMPSVAARADSTERAHAPTAAAVHQVWDRAAAVVAVAEEVAVDAGRTEKGAMR